MKKIHSFTTRLLCLFALFALTSIGFGAEPTVPDRTANPQRVTLSSQNPGSLLVFNLYSSSSTDPGKQDTNMSLTNANASQSAFMHVFFVAASGLTADAYLCLTPNQTVSFLASEVDPGVTGYVIAYATDRNGCPLGFNYLIGSEFVKLESGHAASLEAQSHVALFNGSLPGCSATSVEAAIQLDGVRYSAPARMLAVDKISSYADGNQTMLIVNRLDGNLAIGVLPIGDIEGTVFNDIEDGVQFTGTARTQLKEVLSSRFPLTVPRFETFIGTGRTGWMRLMAKEEIAISGAVIVFNADAATKVNRFSGGHNLHPLRYTSGRLLVPVFQPTC